MPSSHICEEEPWTLSALFSLLSDVLLSIMLFLSSVVSCFTSQLATLLDLHLQHGDHRQLPSSFSGRSFPPASSRLFKEEQAIGGACSICSFRNTEKTESEFFRHPQVSREKSPLQEEEEEEEEIAWKKMDREKVNRKKSARIPVPIDQSCHTEDCDSEFSVDSDKHQSTQKVDHKKSAPILVSVDRSSRNRDQDSKSSVDLDKHQSTQKIDLKRYASVPVSVDRPCHTRDWDSESSGDSEQDRSATCKVDRRKSAMIPVSQTEDRGSKFCIDSDKHPLIRKVDRKKSAPVPVSVDKSSQTEDQDSKFSIDSVKKPITQKVGHKKSTLIAVFIDQSSQIEDQDSKHSIDSNKHLPPHKVVGKKSASIPVSVDQFTQREDQDSKFSTDSDKHLSAWKVDRKKSASIPVSVDQSSQTENQNSKFSIDSDKHLSSRKVDRRKSASIPVFVDRSCQTENQDSAKHQPPQKRDCQKSALIPVSVDHATQTEDWDSQFAVDSDKHPLPQKADRKKSTSIPVSVDQDKKKTASIPVLVDLSTQVERLASEFSMDSDEPPSAQNRKLASVPVFIDQDHNKTASIAALVDQSTQLEDQDSGKHPATQEGDCKKATFIPVLVDRSTHEEDWNLECHHRQDKQNGGILTDSIAASEELPKGQKEMAAVHLSGEREEEEGEEAVSAIEDNNGIFGNLRAGLEESEQEPTFPSDESKPVVEEDAAAQDAAAQDEEDDSNDDDYYLQDIGYIRGLDDLRKAVRDEKKLKTELYAELERERQAAAIAAMETMAMITRLQEEKSAMLLEVSQLHRTAEEKSEHDNQAMAVLTEILLKRETENHALEKEVELFRERLLQREEENNKVLLLKGPDGYGGTSEEEKDPEKDLHRSIPSQSNHGEEQAMESPVGPLFSSGNEEAEFLLEQLWMLEDEISNLKKKTEKKKKKTKTRKDSNPSPQIQSEVERRVSYGPSDSMVANTVGVGNESEFSESVSNEIKIRQGGGTYEVLHLGLKHRRSSWLECSENESSDGGDEHGKLENRGDGHNKLDGRRGRRMRKMRRTVSDPQGMITHFDDWSDASDSDHRSKSMLRRNTKWMITDEEGWMSSQHKARVPVQYLD